MYIYFFFVMFFRNVKTVCWAGSTRRSWTQVVISWTYWTHQTLTLPYSHRPTLRLTIHPSNITWPTGVTSDPCWTCTSFKNVCPSTISLPNLSTRYVSIRTVDEFFYVYFSPSIPLKKKQNILLLFYSIFYCIFACAVPIMILIYLLFSSHFCSQINRCLLFFFLKTYVFCTYAFMICS